MTKNGSAEVKSIRDAKGTGIETRLWRKEREKKQDFEGRNGYLNYKITNTKDKKKTQEEEKKPNKLSTINKS
jgi:hypothetical protein